MKKPLSLIAVTALTLFVGCATRPAATSCCSHKNGDGDGQGVAIGTLPPAAVHAAKKSVPGFEVSCAKLKHKDSGNVYELKGYAKKSKYEIDVTPAGRVLDIERD